MKSLAEMKSPDPFFSDFVSNLCDLSLNAIRLWAELGLTWILSGPCSVGQDNI